MKEACSLYELNHLVRSCLQEVLPDTYWVQAEVASCSTRGGHCYLELIEKKEDSDQLRAKARAMIWSNVWLPLRVYFEEQTGSSLSVGQKILAEVRVDFHELYGMSLTIMDIDPSYTLGEWALRRKKVLDRLQKEGILDLNKELSFPELPQRIAIISSATAAGYEDFMHQLSASGYVFYTKLFSASVQGQQAEASILSALDKILARAEVFDLVVIIRGGGASSDLSCFDGYDLASVIAQFPLPVLSGIGHERDISVVDMVSHTSVKTPTAAAEYLVNVMRDLSNSLEEVLGRLADGVQQLHHQERQRLQQYSEKMKQFVQLKRGKEELYIQKQALSLQQIVERGVMMENQRRVQYKQSLLRVVEKQLQMEKYRVELLNNSIMAYSPEEQLKRGFSITMYQGKILKSPVGIPPGVMIETKLKEGILITTTAKE